MKKHWVKLRDAAHYYKPSKQHVGYNKHYMRNKSLRKNHSSTFNTLLVKGSLDGLVKIHAYTQTERKEHPVDKGYFKECTVLNQKGRERLEKLRKKFNK